MPDERAEDALDPGSELQDYGYKKNLRTALPQILAVSVKNCLLLGYGMTLGFTTILIPAVQKQTGDDDDGKPLVLNSSEISWISSINLIVVPVGCAISGLVTTPLGRRRSMQMVNIPFLLSWLIFHYATTKEHLYAALTLTGLAGGLLEAPVLTYVAEITQPYLRGSLTATSSLCITLGIFTQFLFGLVFYWRTVPLVNIFFTVLSFVLLFFVPESPHWLVSKGRYDEAKLSLQWLRGWTESQNVEEELKDIRNLFNNRDETKDNGEQSQSFSMRITNYTNRGFLLPLFLVSFCFFVQHFSGMTTLQTYAVPIFQMLDAPINKYHATLVLGLIQILGTVAFVILVHRVGKRPLALVSSLGGGINCLLIAIYDVIMVQPQQNVTYESAIANISNSIHGNNTNDTSGTALHTSLSHNPHSWMGLALLMLLAFITHTGIRLLPWILIGEVFNAKTRSGSAGISSAIGYIFGFLTNKMFIGMVDTISIWGTYGMYSFICLSGCVTFYFILPETEGKKLIEIEYHFAGIKKLSNQVQKFEKEERQVATNLNNIQGTNNYINQSFEADEDDTKL